MPYNGSGVWTRLYSWVNDAAANIKIRADRMDNEMNDMANGFSSVITKNGTTTITANLPMAGFRHTGVGNATSRSDYSSFAQVQDGKAAWVDGGGTADAITATYSIPITSLTDGQLCYVRATAANATTTPTFSPNALTARTIVKSGGQALVAGDIAGDGHELILRYDLANTRWELLNPKVTAPSSTFSDSVFRVQDNGDATKQLAFEVSGVTTGTTRTLTVPNASGTILTDATGSITSAQLRGALSDETGSGAAVFATSPTLVTPILGAATATSINFGGATLDTYSTGSFTPTIAGTTLAGTGTYTANRTGRFTRIGDRYDFNIRCEWTAHTGTGNMILTGMPFTAALSTPIAIVASALVSPAGTIVVCLASGTTITFYSLTPATGVIAPLAIDPTADIYIQGTVFI